MFKQIKVTDRFSWKFLPILMSQALFFFFLHGNILKHTERHGILCETHSSGWGSSPSFQMWENLDLASMQFPLDHTEHLRLCRARPPPTLYSLCGTNAMDLMNTCQLPTCPPHLNCEPTKGDMLRTPQRDMPDSSCPPFHK